MALPFDVANFNLIEFANIYNDFIDTNNPKTIQVQLKDENGNIVTKNIDNVGKIIDNINSFQSPSLNLVVNPYFNVTDDNGFPKYWSINNSNWSCNHSFGLDVKDLSWELINFAPVGEYWDNPILSNLADSIGIEIRRCGSVNIRNPIKVLVFKGKTRTECHCSFQIMQRVSRFYSTKNMSAGVYIYSNRWDLVNGSEIMVDCKSARWGGRKHNGTEGVLKLISNNINVRNFGARGITIGVKFNKTQSEEEFTVAFALPFVTIGYSDLFHQLYQIF